jgi:hypothetical protein
MPQSTFSIARNPGLQTTFVVVTQNTYDDGPCQTSVVNTHLAKHRQAKNRQRKVQDLQTNPIKVPDTNRNGSRRTYRWITDEQETKRDGKVLNIAGLQRLGFDEPLLAMLDPFLVLPLQLGVSERSMLGYCRSILCLYRIIGLTDQRPHGGPEHGTRNCQKPSPLRLHQDC